MAVPLGPGPVVVHAASADRFGVWLLDTGGSTHHFPWKEIDQ